MFICIYECIHIYMYINIYTCIYVYIHVYVDLCMSISKTKRAGANTQIHI